MYKLSIVRIYFACFIVVIIAEFFRKISPEYYRFFDAIKEILPIFPCLAILVQLKNRVKGTSAIAAASLCLYVFYGFLISMVRDKGIQVLIYQLYHEIKLPSLLFPALLIKPNKLALKWTEKAIKIITSLCLMLVLARLLFPDQYDALFSSGAHHAKAYFGSLSFTRYVGIFWHPSQLSLFCFLAILFLYKFRRASSKRIWILPLSFLLVLSFQRFEIFLSFLFILVLLSERVLNVFILRNRASTILLTMMLVVAIFFMALASELSTVEKLSDSPRVAFYSHSFREMLKSDFTGAGWGTIGSHAAADITGAYEIGEISSLWWVQSGLYFYDSYWPHVFGETGIPGYIFLSVGLIAMFASVKSLAPKIALLFLFSASVFSGNLVSIFHLTTVGWFVYVLRIGVKTRRH